MQVKQRLRLNVIVSLAAAVVIFLIFLLAVYRLDKATSLTRISGDIVLTSFERVTLRNDYLQNNNERAKAQWFARHVEIGKILESASKEFKAFEDKQILDEMLKKHESIWKLFSAIVENREKKKSTAEDAVLSQEVEDRLLSQLNIKVYEEVVLGRELLESSRKVRSSTIRLTGIGIASLFLALLSAVIINSWIMGRAITNRVQRLRDGASIIGDGDLDHTIDIRGDDEFFELSGAFNEMTAKLKTTYHDLSNEVKERKRAEEALGKAYDELELRVQERTKELSEARETLEQRVAERTAELRAANESLRASRVAALNLMEDAVAARKQAEDANRELEHEVAERRLAEEALRESEEKLSLALRSAGMGVWRLDLSEQKRYFDDQVCRCLGIDPASFGGTVEEFYSAVHPDDRAGIEAALDKTIRSGAPYEVEYRALWPDGRIRHITSRGRLTRDAGGNAQWVGGLVWDISERKQVEEALQRVNEDLEKKVVERTRFYSIRAEISEAIVRISDRQTLFEEVCRIVVETGRFRLAWVGALDRETREVRPVASFGESEYLEGIRIVAAEVPEGKGPTGRAVYEDHCVMNTDFEKDVLLLPWRDRARAHGLRSSSAFPLHTVGQVMGALTIYSDKPGFFTDEEVSLLLSLSEDISFALDAMEGEARRSSAEEALRVLNEELDIRVQKRTAELQAVNKELEAFIYSVSHDLRAPIRSMSGFAKFLVEDCAETLDAQGKDYVRRIEEGAAKMTRIIDDLLYLSRITRQEINRTQINLSALTSSVVSGLRGDDPGRGVEVTVADGITAFADRRLMEVVLSNLLGNAWKFTAKTENVRIEFGALEQEGKMVYYVSDNGAGFDPNYREKMFLPFQRLHSDREFEGMGIGLAIVERVIHRHGGRVWAEGQKEKGATIYFTLGEV